MATQSVEVEPVAGALGAEIGGVDLAEPLDDETFDEILAAFHEHLVIFFRDQDLTQQQHYDFAKRFGGVMEHPYVKGMAGFPEMIEIIKVPQETYNWGGDWHADLTFMAEPPRGAVVYGRELPPVGGDTMFANLALAYETLSEGMREMLDPLGAVHESGEPHRYASTFQEMHEKKGNDEENSVHPVVRTHPVTGRKSLFVNRGFTRRFDEMTAEESRPVLQYLYQHCARPELTCRFRWEQGSMAIWDNRIVLHNALSDDFGSKNGQGFRRVLHRVTMGGEKPH